MNTLIIPCAGKSSRFPNMKPKYMLTHPDGNLMIKKSIENLNLDIFDRIIVTIVKQHDIEYECELILRQAFKDDSRVEICVLDDFTSSASETIFLTIKKMSVKGGIVIKDSDNSVEVLLPQESRNMIVGCDLLKNHDISNVAGKSFILTNEQNIILDIIEKKIVSNVICVGIYCFKNVANFIESYLELKDRNINGEMYISHVISFMISKNIMFELMTSNKYQDWGTIKEWKEVQNKMRTYFVDIDGVIIKNSGKYGSVNWSNNKEILKDNLNLLRKLHENGAQIIFTTSRTEEYRSIIENILDEAGIKSYQIVMGLRHSRRVLINDFASTNRYPSCTAISIPRNGRLEDYIDS